MLYDTTLGRCSVGAVVQVRTTELLLCRGMDAVWWVDDAVVLVLATVLLLCHGRDTG